MARAAKTLLSRIRAHPLGALLVTLGTIVIALSTFTDAATNLLGLIRKNGPDAARLELSKLGLEYTPTAFIGSAEKGDPRAVRLFLAAGMDPNASDDEGNTALIYAARDGNAAILEALLKVKADVDVINDNGGTALSWAAAAGESTAVRTLLDYGAEPATIDSAFVIAAAEGRQGVLPIFLGERAIPSAVRSEALLEAAGSSSEGEADSKRDELITFLIDAGADVNAAGYEGWTPLLHATERGNVRGARTLLARGADIDVQCDCPGFLNGGWSALMMAIKRGHADIVQALLQKAPDVNLKNRLGQTALMLAVEEGDRSTVSALVTRGARPNEQDVSGKTALQLADDDLEGETRAEIVRLLRSGGAK
jgi:ankyrin repeat protein